MTDCCLLQRYSRYMTNFKALFFWMFSFDIRLAFYSCNIVQQLKAMFLSSSLCAEQQPRLRGWLLASVDGQLTGLVPANYIKVLGKRRGRKHAELERLAQAQQGAPQTDPAAAGLQPTLASGFTPGLLHPVSTSAASEDLLDSVYRETSAPFSLETPNSLPPSTVLNIPDRIDL